MPGYNMPDGVTGGEDYFNPPDPPECPDCYADLDWEWLYCPFCGRKLRPDEWADDVYVGPQMYDSRRDLEFDRALDGE